jgi:trans-aconitate methyltransferase
MVVEWIKSTVDDPFELLQAIAIDGETFLTTYRKEIKEAVAEMQKRRVKTFKGEKK